MVNSKGQEINMTTKSIYIVGSLKNIPAIQAFAIELRAHLALLDLGINIEVKDDWTSHGPDPDTYFCEYALARKFSYSEALNNPVARSVFFTDKAFIDAASAVILLQPAGRSAMGELCYAAGKGKATAIIKESAYYDRVEIMELFSDVISNDQEEFFKSGLAQILERIVPKRDQFSWVE